MRYKYLFFSILFSLFCSSTFAQHFTVKADVDSVQLLIGEQAKLTFTISQDPNTIVIAPIFSDTIVNGLEIVQQLKKDTSVDASGQLQINQSYVVTGFDSALIYIPEYPFVADGDTEYSNSLSLKILSIPVDTAQQSIADIKPIVKAPFDWGLFFRIVLIVILVALVVFVAIYLYRKFHKKGSVNEIDLPVTDNRPAHEIAFEQIEKVRAAHIWQEGRIKEYYTQVTDIMREYLNRRYHVATFEHTSDEILHEINHQKVLADSEDFSLLQAVLQVSDLVKFAKYIPTASDNDGVLKHVYKFVDETKEIPQEPEENKKADKSDE